VKLRDGEVQAKSLLISILSSAQTGKRWVQVWPLVLNDAVITRSKLGRMVNEMRKNGEIDAPGWPSERHYIPADNQLLRLI
jgi:hypothetical protein